MTEPKKMTTTDFFACFGRAAVEAATTGSIDKAREELRPIFEGVRAGLTGNDSDDPEAITTEGEPCEQTPDSDPPDDSPPS